MDLDHDLDVPSEPGTALATMLPQRHDRGAAPVMSLLDRFTPRMILRRGADQVAYLTRWGIRTRWCNIYLHRFDGPDPGFDLHDHPWAFTSIILRGGYTEERASSLVALAVAKAAERLQHKWGFTMSRGTVTEHYGFGAINRMPLTDSHRITRVVPGTLTLVITGPVRRSWGFMTPDGYVRHDYYEHPDRSLTVELPREVSAAETKEYQ